MKKLLLGLTLLSSMSLFAGEETDRVQECENNVMGIVSDMMSSSTLSVDDMLSITAGPVVDKMLETCSLLDTAIKAKESN